MIKKLAPKKRGQASLFLAGLILIIASLGCSVSGPGIPPAHYANPITNLAWTADGKQIVFSRDVQGTFVYDISELRFHTIPLNSPIGDFWEPTSASGALSPDGSRVAYVAVFNDRFLRIPNAEIMTANIDGTDVRRLTRSTNYADTNPAWSPDGSRIAYISNEADGTVVLVDVEGTTIWKVTLSTDDYTNYYFPPDWAPDGSWLAVQYSSFSLESVPHRREGVLFMGADGKGVLDFGGSASVSKPVWSPDSRWVGFHSREGENEEEKGYINLVRPDGSEVLKLEDGASSPAWSPDGSRIAFFMSGESGLTLETANTDGTGRMNVLKLAHIGRWMPSGLAWSPDGTALLFSVTFDPGLSQPDRRLWYIVNMEERSILASFEGQAAEWSPDGSRIALVTGYPVNYYGDRSEGDVEIDVLYTLARDGTQEDVLVRGTAERIYAELVSRDVPRGAAACLDDRVVPVPETNSGLVEDCRTLMALRDQMAGGILLNWSEHTPIEQWTGVLVSGSTPRVRGLRIPVGGGSQPALTGVIPPELGKLSALESLDLSGHALSGSIPAELGAFGILGLLYLHGNNLSGNIPSELGNLSELRGLQLQNNSLTGSIPPELGNLANLYQLDISGNNLSGCVPKALSDNVTNLVTDGLDVCAE